MADFNQAAPQMDDLTLLVYLLGSLPLDTQREMIRKFTDETNGALRACSVRHGA